MWTFPLFPDQASSHAGRVDALYFFEIGVLVFFTALICFLTLYFAIKYRRGSQADRANPVESNHKLEAVWIVIPTLIAMVMFFWSSFLYFEIYNPPEDAAEVYVVGKQWMWYVQHPEGKSEINQLHVPVGQAVKLVMTSQDVIHDFFIPAFRVKQDVLPGRYTSLWFRPTRIGTFHLFCAEYCGTNHASMGGSVVVMEPAEYEQWLEQGDVVASMAADGADLFRQYHCSGCHGANASAGRAPKLEGIYGGSAPIQVGNDVRFVKVDDRYLMDSIRRPGSEVVAGYEPIMPAFPREQLGDPDLLKILAYIKSIGRNTTRSER